MVSGTGREADHIQTFPRNMAYTQETLLADWNSLHPDEPMPLELQTLLMRFVNAPRMQRPTNSRYQAILPASAPPPQRFQAPRNRGEKTPAGPSNPSKTQASILNCSVNLLDECNGAQLDEIDLAFAAIHSK